VEKSRQKPQERMKILSDVSCYAKLGDTNLIHLSGIRNLTIISAEGT